MDKFSDKLITAKNETRAWVDFLGLKTLWFNTGTLCNLSCKNCYIESSPTNDALVYLSAAEVTKYLDEIQSGRDKVDLIGLTGGEPFLNPEIIPIMESILSAGHELLVLTNAFRVLKRHANKLLNLKEIYGNKLFIRVSLDHFSREEHEKQRGTDTFERTLEAMKWLHDEGFQLSIAGRSIIGEDKVSTLHGYQALLNDKNIALDLELGENIVIFPEMIPDENVPEITTECWGILNKSPADQMCATERMVIKRKNQNTPTVVACTLLAYAPEFEFGETLADARESVYLNHPFCAKFCVLGGGSCSSTK